MKEEMKEAFTVTIVRVGPLSVSMSPEDSCSRCYECNDDACEAVGDRGTRARFESTAEVAGVVKSGNGTSASFTVTLSYDCAERSACCAQCRNMGKQCRMYSQQRDRIDYEMTATKDDDDDSSEDLTCVLATLSDNYVDDYDDDPTI